MRAFSLVELSIVLVILGLLTGGILTGQSLIRAAELRKLTSSLMRYQTSIYTFRDKYQALPGDMLNATSFWTASDGSTGKTSGCYSIPQTTGTATCNGDGNGVISNVSWGSEALLAWKHLANAGLVEGSYTGIGGSDSASRNYHIPGTNCPSSIDQTCTLLGSRSSYDANEDFPLTGSSLWLRTGKDWGDGTPRKPFLKPEEQWNIDVKQDDGKPGLGSVRALIKSSTISPDCTTSDDAATANYNLSGNNPCTLDIYIPY